MRKRIISRVPLRPLVLLILVCLVALGADGPLTVAVPEPGEKALRFYRTGHLYWAVGVLWGLVLPFGIFFSGISRRIRDFAWSVGKRWYLAFATYAVCYLVLTFVCTLPLSYQRGYVRLHEYRISTESFAKWAGDAGKNLLIDVVGVLCFGWVPFLLLKRAPKTWWLITAGLYVPFLFFVMLIKPVMLDPMFNKFGPMNDRALEAKILALAERSGIDGGRVFEVDKSSETVAINAYVTGIGASKRIVLWDTLLTKLDEREVLFVMAHEMGHYVLGHVNRTILLSTILVLAGLGLIHVVAGRILRRFGSRLGVTELSDFAALPLIVGLFAATYLLLTPIGLAYSRAQEHESDRFALELTRDNHAGALGFAKMQRENLSNPRPDAWWVFLRSTHPTGGERIDFCNEYRPWEQGKPLVYEGLFRPENP